MDAAPATGLQRSTTSFRRQGSSGLVWEDRFLSGELTQPKKKEEEEGNVSGQQTEPKEQTSGGGGGIAPVDVTMERSRSGGGRTWRTGKVSPAIDPPSPRVSGCGLCGVFGKPVGDRKKPKHRKKR